MDAVLYTVLCFFFYKRLLFSVKYASIPIDHFLKSYKNAEYFIKKTDFL